MRLFIFDDTTVVVNGLRMYFQEYFHHPPISIHIRYTLKKKTIYNFHRTSTFFKFFINIVSCNTYNANGDPPCYYGNTAHRITHKLDRFWCSAFKPVPLEIGNCNTISISYLTRSRAPVLYLFCLNEDMDGYF